MMAEMSQLKMEGMNEEILMVDNSVGRDKESVFFDTVVNQLQEIAVTPEFQDVRDGFLGQHAAVFEDTEENKLEYMMIFKEWTALIEGYLERSLAARVAGFRMDDFIRLLGMRQDQIDSELFDMLASLADFSLFKEEILEFKQAQAFGGFDGFVVHSL